MFQRFVTQLPPWARPDHPVMHYELNRTKVSALRGRLGRAFWHILLLSLFAGVGLGAYWIQTGLLKRSLGQTFTESAMTVLFWPSFVMLIVMSVAALLLTSGVISQQVQQQNWNKIRSTEKGAEYILRTRWIAVFYRLRLLLALILVIRLVLVFGIMGDLTGFQGRYLVLLINGITPEVPVWLAFVLSLCLMTASLLLPFTSLGMDAALGLYLATFVHHKAAVALLQIGLVIFRIAYVVALYWAAFNILQGIILVEGGAVQWFILAAYGSLGDWGISMLQLGSFGQIMAFIPYGIFLGLGMLVFALLQTLLADSIMVRAIRRAEQIG